MGGSDQPNATGWVLSVLADMALDPDLHVTIVMGPTAPHLKQVQAQAAALPCRTTVLSGTSRMGDLMVQADFAIGAAGSTSWERCCLGLPSVMVVLADNQQGIARALGQAGAATVIKMNHDSALNSAVQMALNDEVFRSEMAMKASEIVDGHGAGRVLAALQKDL